MGLSHNVKNQLLCAIIQVDYLILHNYTKHVCNHVYKFKKNLNLKQGFQIDLYFVHICLANFNRYYVVTHENIFALCKLHQTIHKFQHKQNTWQVEDHANVT
jgi:hypothetical protein